MNKNKKNFDKKRKEKKTVVFFGGKAKEKLIKFLHDLCCVDEGFNIGYISDNKCLLININDQIVGNKT